MKQIAIYGAGGFGREVACMIEQINSVEPTWQLLGFFDDGVAPGTEISHFGKVLGNYEVLNHWTSPISVAVCIGVPRIVKKVVERVDNPMVDFPNLIHPNFNIIDPYTFVIGKRNIIKGGCSCTTNVRLGDFNVLNGRVNFGHDIFVGNFNTFMPGTTISGEVTIGNENLFGVNAIVIQCIKIGDSITLSPGSVLLKKPKNGGLYIGNPAKLLKY